LEKSKDSEYMEKERLRSRDKYNRLYKGKKTEKAKLKENKYTSLRNARRDFNTTLSNDFELHHWNYNITDNVIVLDKRLHHRLHNNISFSFEEGIYYYNGQKLDSLEKHLDVIRDVCNKYDFDFSDVTVLTK